MKTLSSHIAVRNVPIEIEIESDKVNSSTKNTEQKKHEHIIDHNRLDTRIEHEQLIPKNSEYIPSNTLIVPIKIEVNHNANKPVTISKETKEQQLTKRTAQLGSEIHNEQTVWRGELNKGKESARHTHDTSRRVPIKMEQPEENNEPDYQLVVETDCQSSSSKEEPEDLGRITTKPPLDKQNIPVGRAVIGDKRDKKIEHERLSRERFSPDMNNAENIDANSEQVEEQLPVARKDLREVEPRSQSVGAESRIPSGRTKRSSARYSFRRERSMEDIDKDIATLWRELQDLDKQPESKNRKSENKTTKRPSSDDAHPSPLPLSEQELVIPSWRATTPTVNRRASTTRNSLVINRSPSPHLASSTTARTIWDPPDEEPHSALSYNQHISSPANYFSFVPKVETKPGAIMPTCVNIKPPIPSSIKPKSNGIDDSLTGQEVCEEYLSRSNSLPRTKTDWPESYNSFQKIQSYSSTGARSKESTPLKSCLKLDSRSNSLGRASRSKSPSSRASPAKQNVNFKQEPILTKFQMENEISLLDQPLKKINSKDNQNSEEISKAKTPPKQTKLYDSKNLRVVPIFKNVSKRKDCLDNSLSTQQSDETSEVPILIKQSKYDSNLNPFLSDDDDRSDSSIVKSPFPPNQDLQNSKIQAPLATEELCYACDACTQTEDKHKKESCHVM